MIAGKHAFLALLRDEGVDWLFGNPGSTELSLMDALSVEDSPRFVLGLHEGVVMSMAHGHAASTGRLAAAVLHAAPGLGNALGMLYNVKRANAPLLVVAGQQDLSIAVREPLLWDDLATMARPFVKWSVEVTRLADLPRIVRRAAKVALTPPMGPVFLSLPGDLLAEEADLDFLASCRIAAGQRADRDTMEQGAALIAKAERPLIFAGDSVAQGHAIPALVRLAEMLGAPVHWEAMADRCTFPTSHPLFAGVLPRLGPAVREATQRHDLLISVGGDLFTESLATDIDPIAPGTAIVHIDNDPWQIGKNYPTACALLGDPAAVLPELHPLIEQRLDDGMRTRIARRCDEAKAANRKRRDALIARADAGMASPPIPPLSLLRAIGEMLPADAIVVEELLSSLPGLADLLRLEDECSYFGLRGGGIGAALPQAIGIKLAHPGRPVVALVGDGSAMFSFQALWTAAHEHVPVTFVIFNNASYRILKQRTLALGGHAARTGRLVAMDLNDPPIDFVALAGAMGVAATRTESIPAFRSAFTEALSAGVPRLIDAAIDGAV